MKKKTTSKKKVHIPLTHDEAHKGNKLSDIILGGQDGLVNVLGVALGVAAASMSLTEIEGHRIVLAAGLAATFAESISMAAVAYTSKIAERDFYYSELEREKREIKEVPEVEEEEIREIYRQKGFKGELLEKIVKVIISDEEIWLKTMMRDELDLSPVAHGRPYSAAFYVGFSAFFGSLIPLFPFIFLSIQNGIIVSIAVSALALFIVGGVKAKMTVGTIGKSGLEMMIIGIVSALAGFGVGLLFNQ